MFSGMRWASSLGLVDVWGVGYKSITGGAMVADGGRQVLSLYHTIMNAGSYRQYALDETAPGSSVWRVTNFWVKGNSLTGDQNVFMAFTDDISAQGADELPVLCYYDDGTLAFGYITAPSTWNESDTAAVNDASAYTKISVRHKPSTGEVEVWADGVEKFSVTDVSLKWDDIWGRPWGRYLTAKGDPGPDFYFKDMINTIEDGDVLNGVLDMADYSFDIRSPTSDAVVSGGWVGNPDNVDLWKNWNGLPFELVAFNSHTSVGSCLSGFPAASPGEGEQVLGAVGYHLTAGMTEVDRFRARFNAGAEYNGPLLQLVDDPDSSPSQWNAYTANGADWTTALFDAWDVGGYGSGSTDEWWGHAIEAIYGPAVEEEAAHVRQGVALGSANAMAFS